jgi:hypothetical protein
MVSKSADPPTRDRGFESGSLHQRVGCEPDLLSLARDVPPAQHPHIHVHQWRRASLTDLPGRLRTSGSSPNASKIDDLRQRIANTGNASDSQIAVRTRTLEFQTEDHTLRTGNPRNVG